MASRGRTTSGSSRRIAVLAVSILVALCTYTAGWFYLANRVDARITAALASIAASGDQLTCANRDIRGYPFRIGLHCETIGFSDPGTGLSFSAGNLRSAGQIYNPRLLVGEIDSPANLTWQDMVPMQLAWDNVRASLRLGGDFPQRLSVETRAFSASRARGAAAGQLLFQAEQAEAHLRPHGPDLDLAVRFTGLALQPDTTGGRRVPPISGVIDLAVHNGVPWLRGGHAGLRGQSGTIRELSLSPGEQTGIKATGPISVDANGHLDAELQITVRDPQALEAMLTSTLPGSAQAIRAGLSALAALAGHDDKTAAIAVRIVKGKVTVGFLTLAHIPPL